MTEEGARDEFLLDIATSRLRSWRPTGHIGLAVSGGGDSMAMLWLIAPWAKANGIAVSAATVDHRLRPEAAAEARLVALACEDLGVPHATLRWDGWSGQGNLQAAAREGRRDLLTGWASSRGVEVVLLAHTRDDQAETFLMRLARGSGVDGLAAMSVDWQERGLRWMRPLLTETRTDLRAYLQRHGRAWIEDPSNSNDDFLRVRARSALAALEPLGIDSRRISRTAFVLSWGSEALNHIAVEAAERIAVLQGGDVGFSRGEFEKLPVETRGRLAAAAIQWVSSTTYRPRLASLLETVLWASPKRTTLQGTLIRRRGLGGDARIVIGREPRAASRAASAPTTALWDGRWHLRGPHAPDLEVRMLGEAGIALCPRWRESDLERSSVLASPAVWRGTALVAAPLAGWPEGWTAETVPDFRAFLRWGR